MASTLVDKLWDAHTVHAGSDGQDLLYIDLHLTHEVTSPQAFDALRAAGRRVRRPDLTMATVDHAVPTTDRSFRILDSDAREQIGALERNCGEFGVPLHGLDSRARGIVHVIGPELGLTLPGMTIVCGDSHTATHGAFGALAFGIGSSEVEHVLATQTLPQVRPGTISIVVNGKRPFGVTPKDMILNTINRIGVAGGVGHVIEYSGDAIEALTMDGRMTVCNMSIEAGARAGLIAPDETTFEYVHGRMHAPKGKHWETAMRSWENLASDAGAEYDIRISLDVEDFEPTVTWGTNPAMSAPVSGKVPDPSDTTEPEQTRRALEYMNLEPGTRITDIGIDKVFLGSCTNARLSDLEAAAKVVDGRKVAPGVTAIVVPGSNRVKQQAEAKGLNQLFTSAGFEWREAGCSMCIAMNPDIVNPGERCASTSNRNFEGRQGRGARTHLVSPEMAAGAAVFGRFVDVRDGA